MPKRSVAKPFNLSKIRETTYLKVVDRNIPLIEGEAVVKIKVYGTILQKFLNSSNTEDNNIRRKSVHVAICDNSNSIMWVRNWQYGDEINQAYRVLSESKIGQIVEIIGRVRQYNNKNYVIAELAKLVDFEYELNFRASKIKLLINN